MRNRTQAFLLALTSLLMATTVDADETKRAYVGVFLHDIAHFDQMNGTFEADMEMWVKWRGEFDPTNVRIANAAETQEENVTTESDGDWHVARKRVRGTFRGNFPLHRFPIDSQRVRIEFELEQQLREIVPDLAASGMSKSFSITDWEYTPEFIPVVEDHSYPSDMGRLASESHALMTRSAGFEVRLKRPAVPVVLKLFLPLLIIILVALSQFVLPPAQIDARSAIGVTALLSCFAAQFTVASNLPEVSYLTFADCLFIISYVFTCVALAETIVVYQLDRRERTGAATSIDRLTLLSLPAAAIAAIFVFLPAERAPRSVQVEPLEMPKPAASERDTLRVGSNVLRRLTGSMVWSGARWSLVQQDGDDDDEKYPVYATAVPSISTKSITFEADGSLRVDWQLRKGSKWSDGSPLSTKDVALTYQVFPSSFLDKVEIKDELQFTVHWKEKVNEAFYAVRPRSSEHYGKHVDDAGDADKGAGDAIKEAERDDVIKGLGPYRFTSYKKGEHAHVERNPHFAGPKAAIGKIEVRAYENDEALVAALLKGEIDLILPNSITVETARSLQAKRPDWVNFRASSAFIFLQPDLKVPILQNAKVRRAIVLAIDREEMLREIYGEMAPVAHCVYPGKLPDGAEKVPHDPEQAKALLEGVDPGQLVLPLLIDDSEIDQAMAAHIIEDLEKVGFRLQRKLVKSTFNTAKTDHAGLVLHIKRGTRKSVLRYWNLPAADGLYDVDARTAAFDDDVAELYYLHQRALYPERRQQIRDQLTIAFQKKLPLLPLAFAMERIVADPALVGWDRLPSSVAFGSDIHRWYFKKRTQKTD